MLLLAAVSYVTVTSGHVVNVVDGIGVNEYIASNAIITPLASCQECRTWQANAWLVGTVVHYGCRYHRR